MEGMNNENRGYVEGGGGEKRDCEREGGAEVLKSSASPRTAMRRERRADRNVQGGSRFWKRMVEGDREDSYAGGKKEEGSTRNEGEEVLETSRKLQGGTGEKSAGGERTQKKGYGNCGSNQDRASFIKKKKKGKSTERSGGTRCSHPPRGTGVRTKKTERTLFNHRGNEEPSQKGDRWKRKAKRRARTG